MKNKTQSSNPLISIIIPVYNTAAYLPRCLASVCAQTYKNLEILVINDGSTDNSGQICDDWAKKDARIKVFHKPNGGVSSARNLALDKAKGEYIGFVDSDDEIHPQMYEILLKNIQKYQADIAACQWTVIEDGENPTFSPAYPTAPKLLSTRADIFYALSAPSYARL